MQIKKYSSLNYPSLSHISLQICNGVQNRPPQNMPHCILTFELKLLEKQPVQKEHFNPHLFLLKAGINLPHAPRGKETSLCQREGIQGREDCVNKLCLDYSLIKCPSLSFFVLSIPHKFMGLFLFLFWRFLFFS